MWLLFVGAAPAALRATTSPRSSGACTEYTISCANNKTLVSIVSAHNAVYKRQNLESDNQNSKNKFFFFILLQFYTIKFVKKINFG